MLCQKGDMQSYSILYRDDLLQRKLPYNKFVPEIRPLKSHSFPMTLSMFSIELEPSLGKEYADQLLRKIIDKICTDFYKKDCEAVLEDVALDGDFVDPFEGWLLNPGDTVESRWFPMDTGKRLGDNGIIREAADIVPEALERGRDKDFGSFFYSCNSQGFSCKNKIFNGGEES
jgi:N-acylglucosamine 2-epimerase